MTTVNENKSEIKNYDRDVELLFIQFFLSDPELFIRCIGVIDPEHYNDAKNKKAVAFIKDYAQKYSALPPREMLKSVVGFEINEIINCGEAEKTWFLNEYEIFARHKALENAILASPDLLMEHRYGEVEVMIKSAVSIGLVKDLGLSYFKDPLARLNDVANSRGACSTGWVGVDEKLYGGLNRGEITIIAGQSGAGKSIFLQNFAVNWVSMGLNVLYLSLELSEKLCAMRIDAMHTDYGTRDVLKNRDDVDLKLRMLHKKNGGSLQIKQLKNGCDANDIKAYVKEYEIQSGIKVDAILLDYLDLCMPTNAKISPDNLFVKDKYVTENMRDLAVELDCLFVSASQLNRSSHETDVFSHASIAGGLSKINTADNVLAIYVTDAMKEAGRYQLQFMKTRSSAGVGSKIDLGFSVKSLRIHDLAPGAVGAVQLQTQALLANIQTTKEAEADDEDDDDVSVNPKAGTSALIGAANLSNILNRLSHKYDK